MTTQINQTPLEMAVRAYFKNNNLKFEEKVEQKDSLTELTNWTLSIVSEQGPHFVYDRSIIVLKGTKYQIPHYVNHQQDVRKYIEELDFVGEHRKVMIDYHAEHDEVYRAIVQNGKMGLFEPKTLEEFAELLVDTPLELKLKQVA